MWSVLLCPIWSLVEVHSQPTLNVAGDTLSTESMPHSLKRTPFIRSTTPLAGDGKLYNYINRPRWSDMVDVNLKDKPSI